MSPAHGTAGRPVVPDSGAYLGLWSTPDAAASKSEQIARWEAREAAAGRTYDIGHYFRNFSQGKGDILNWRAQYQIDSGRIPMISWNGGGQSLANEIVAGSHDGGIRTAAQRVRDLGTPVFLRFWWEMDADGLTPASYIAAWRHVHSIWQQEGATNAAFVWCPNAWDWHGTWRGTGGKHFYPGDAYVDWVCSDGYNWYPGKSAGQPDEDFATIYDEFYDWTVANTNKPILIGEFGAMEYAGQNGTPVDPNGKADWIADAAQTVKSRYPRIRALVYFDEDATIVHGHHNWSLDSSTAAYNAWNTNFAGDPYFNPRTADPPPPPPPPPEKEPDIPAPDDVPGSVVSGSEPAQTAAAPTATVRVPMSLAEAFVHFGEVPDTIAGLFGSVAITDPGGTARAHAAAPADRAAPSLVYPGLGFLRYAPTGGALWHRR